MVQFAIYLHPQAFATSKKAELISFRGYSYPYYNQVRKSLFQAVSKYPSLAPRKASIDDYLRVHTREYIRKILLKALDQPLDSISQGLPSCIDCEGLEYCLPGYLYGLGGMIAAIDEFRQGSLERAYCFSMVGHHAHSNWGHGYCLLNPLAAAVRYAQTQGFAKVVIIDWDIHHGDGTQSIFSGDQNIYCISIHNAVDLYMAKASDLRVGTTTFAASVGHCNIPVISPNFPVAALAEDGITGKFYQGHESISIFEHALSQVPWEPSLIAIFSGYDSHKDDCGRDTTGWTEVDFCKLTEIVLRFAKKYSCPILSTHGGGYQLSVTVLAATAHIQTLAGYG
jgi:acetoin utilization deacetylase AcuC-like enzyme